LPESRLPAGTVDAALPWPWLGLACISGWGGPADQMPACPFLHQQVQCAVKEASSPPPEMLQQAVTLSGSPGEGSVSSAEGPADEEAAAPQADQQPEQPARGIKSGACVPQHTQHLAPSATTLPVRQSERDGGDTPTWLNMLCSTTTILLPIPLPVPLLGAGHHLPSWYVYDPARPAQQTGAVAATAV
jgi:hypothetical protein